MSFRIAVKHSSAVRRSTENVICRVTSDDGVVGIGEGCPRRYVTGETTTSAREFLRTHASAAGLAAAADGLAGLSRWIATNRSLIDQNPAATAALEIAVADMTAKSRDVPIEVVFGQPRLEGTFTYSAVLGDSEPLIHNLLLRSYLWNGFRDFKLKLSGDITRDRKKVRLIRSRPGVRIRVDANNLWNQPGPCIDHLRRLDIDLFAIEEPLAAGDLTGFEEVAAALGTRIVLDESALRVDQLVDLPGDPSMWILNCRVSKMGGVGRSLEAIAAASVAGLGIIVGAQVGETSVLSRAALTVAAAAGHDLVGQEGAFGTFLLRQDFTEAVLRFDRAGRIRAGGQFDPDAPGLGLDGRDGALVNIEEVGESLRPPGYGRA